MRMFLLGVAVAALLFGGTLLAASELGGEVVFLTTRDARGREHTTSFWIVEDQGSPWLRAGSGESAWVQRLRADPIVRVERHGVAHRYSAVADPQQTARINALVAQKYGLADRIISLVRDNAKSMAIRLDRLDSPPPDARTRAP